MLIKKDEKLSTKELYTNIGINRDTWKNNKEYILQQLGEVCQYEIEYKGRSTIYHFLTDCDYTYTRKNAKGTSNKDKVYKEAILEVVKKQPLNTAKNVSRIIYNKESIQQFNYAEGTNYEYTRNNMRLMFGTKVQEVNAIDIDDNKKGYIKEKIWCFRVNNEYMPMPQTAIDHFMDIVSKCLKEIKKEEIEALEDYNNGNISKEEFNEMAGYFLNEKYTRAKKEFSNQTGYNPIKVPYYVVFESDKKGE